jgi:hypothetical protein
MKKLFTVFVVLFSLLAFTGVVLAEDVVLNAPVERAIVKKDKNGNAYVRVLIQDKRELNGVTYDKTTSAMAFGDQVTTAAKLKKGDTLNVIASKSDYRGGVSYQILKFLK